MKSARAAVDAPADVLDERLRGRIDLARVVAVAAESARAAMRARRASAGRSAHANARRASSQVTPRSKPRSPRRRAARRSPRASRRALRSRSARRRSTSGSASIQSTRSQCAAHRVPIVVALALAQVRARLEDRIARRQRVARRERVQEIGGEPAAAAAELDDLAARRSRRGSAPTCAASAVANSGVISGRGDEIARPRRACVAPAA